MKNDFTTLIPRINTGSTKWNQMLSWNDQLPEDVIPLTVADMELPNPPLVIQGLKDYLERVPMGYTMAKDSYYEAVCDWMKRRHGYDVQAESIVVVPGVVNAFHAAVKALSEPGEGVIIMRPVYYPFFGAIEEHGRTLFNCPLIHDEGYYRIDFENFEKLAVVPENKVLLFCSPHNPVGRVWTPEELNQVGEICFRHGLKIISDEIWNDLIMPGYEHRMLASLSKEIEAITVTCTAPSKTFNLAGLAASNTIITDEKIREQYRATLQNMRSSSVNMMGLEACELAYRTSEGWLDELLLLLDHNQRLVKDFLDQNHPAITSRYMEGTYLQWLDFSALNFSPEAREEFFYHKAFFISQDGANFGPEGKGYERINIACPTWVLQKQLDRLSAALKEIGY